MTSAKPHVDDEQRVSRLIGREGVRRFFPIFLLVALAVAFSLTSARFLQFNNLMIVAQQAVVLLVAALGMTFVVIAGSIDLSVGAIVAVAALVVAKTSGSIGVLAILPACAIGVVCGLINGLIVAKGKVPSFIVTLGAMVVYRGIVLYFTRGAPGSSKTNRSSMPIRPHGWNPEFRPDRCGLDPHRGFHAEPDRVRARGARDRRGRAHCALERHPGRSNQDPDLRALGLLCGMAGLLQGARAMAATAQLGEGLELDAIAAVVVGGTPLTGGVGSIQGRSLALLHHHPLERDEHHRDLIPISRTS